MIRRVRLRIAGVHAERIYKHLYPGDGNEAVAFALCGRHRHGDVEVLLVQEVIPVPYADCDVREPDRVTWRTDAIELVLQQAARQKLGVVKFHSHPGGYDRFSRTDDESDRDLFPSVYGWVDDDGPHASVVLLPDGRYFGRSIDVDNAFHSLEQVLVVGHDIGVFAETPTKSLPEHARRCTRRSESGPLAGLKVGHPNAKPRASMGDAPDGSGHSYSSCRSRTR